MTQPLVAIERLLALVLALDEERATSAPALAERLQVSLRTVYRDVKRLQDAGVPVVSEPGRSGGLRLMPGFRMAPLALSTGETLALTLAIELLRAQPDRPFARELESAAHKIAAAARVARPELLDDPAQWLRVEPPAADTFHPEKANDHRAETGAAVQTFVEALVAGRRVRIDYRSPYRREVEAQRFDPAGLMLDRGLWYLIAFESEQLGKPRHLRADRVKSCELDERMDIGRQPRWRPGPPRPWLREAMQQWIAQAPVELELSAAQGARLAADWYFGSGELEAVSGDRMRFRWGEGEFERVRELLAWLGAPARLIAPTQWIEPMCASLLAQAGLHS